MILFSSPLQNLVYRGGMELCYGVYRTTLAVSGEPTNCPPDPISFGSFFKHTRADWLDELLSLLEQIRVWKWTKCPEIYLISITELVVHLVRAICITRQRCFFQVVPWKNNQNICWNLAVADVCDLSDLCVCEKKEENSLFFFSCFISHDPLISLIRCVSRWSPRCWLSPSSMLSDLGPRPSHFLCGGGGGSIMCTSSSWNIISCLVSFSLSWFSSLLCCAFCTPPPPPSVCCCNFFFPFHRHFLLGFKKKLRNSIRQVASSAQTEHITQPSHPPSRRLECLSLDEKVKKKKEFFFLVWERVTISTALVRRAIGNVVWITRANDRELRHGGDWSGVAWPGRYEKSPFFFRWRLRITAERQFGIWFAWVVFISRLLYY